MKMGKADRNRLVENWSVTHSRTAHEPANGERKGRWRKSVAVQSWIMIYRLRNSLFSNKLFPLAVACVCVCTLHARRTSVHKIFFNSTGLRLVSGPQFIHKYNKRIHRCSSCGRGNINSVGIDFDLNSKCTQHTICVGFGLDDCAFVCICWLIRKAKSIRRKIQYKRYCEL